MIRVRRHSMLLIVAIVLAVVLALLSSPLRGRTNNGFSPLGVSSVWQGQGLLQHASAAPLWVEWRWCPDLNPLSWCVSARGADISIDGRISTGLSASRFILHDAEVELPLSLLSGIPSRGTFHKKVQRLEWERGRCLPFLSGAIDCEGEQTW